MRSIILAGSMCMLSTLAWAQAPKVGDRMVVANVIVCDTKAQVLDLYAGTKTDGGKGIIPKYLEYNETRDKAGEPTCNMQAVVGAAIKSVQDLGISNGFSGNTVRGWLVEVEGDKGASGWVLYGEEIAPAASQMSI
jgi:hypothetical protein